ncbi:MAG: transporter substrate-binding domain-containing protein, partial [Candidatus Hydrogenedentes bacterium]|nr:transporter substrate-binding domain-containing protein [Candidatus Hydrogenedentota bacterium]
MSSTHLLRASAAVVASLLALAVFASDSPAADEAPPHGTQPPFRLTDVEQAWLDEHPVIRAACTPDWPPFEFVDSDGVYKGICADFLERLSRRVGFEVDVVLEDWPTLYSMLKAGELDVCSSMGITPERQRVFLFTKAFLDFPHAIYVRASERSISSLEDLDGKTVAIEEGYYTHEFLAAKHPEIRLLPVGSALQALLKVASGEADAYLGNVAVASYLLDQNVIMGIRPVWCTEVESLRLAISVRKDYAPLVDILNRAIDELTAVEKRAIVAHYAVVPHWADLSEAELAWIQAHPDIRLGVDPEFAPFEFVDDDGVYQGMASEYVQLLNQRLGLNMQVVHQTSWVEAVELASAHELDVLPCVALTEARRGRFLFSEPYLSFYRVIVTREDGPLVTGLGGVSGLRVAVQKNTSHHGYVLAHLDAPPLLFDTAQRTLAAVSRGEADVAVGNVATVSYWIRKQGMANLRISAPVDEGVDHLRFAVRTDWPELVPILNKGLASVTEEEAHAIRSKWVGVSVTPGLDPVRVLRLVGTVVAVAAVFLGLLALHNRRLRKEIRVRRRTQEALRRSEADYRTLVESANSVILRMTPDGDVLFVNAFAQRLFGYTADEMVGRNVVGTIVPEEDTHGRDLRELMAELTSRPEAFEANENENVTKSGERVWVAWTNRPLYDAVGNLKEILCVGADMTARKQAEEVLSRYEFIVNTVGDMMSVMNAEGRYEALNTAWCTATGISREAALDKKVSEVWTREVAEERILPGLRACLKGEIVTYESVIELPARGQRHCEVTMYPYAGPSGVVSHVVVVTHDVTDWRTAQAALDEARQAAEAANRAKSAFLANMSHEIRTPMNAILGYTQLLLRHTGLLPDQKHAIEAISRSGDHLLALINDVLEMSKIEAGRAELHPASFDLRGLLMDIEMMFRVRTNAKNLGLSMEVADSVPGVIRADESRVRAILINLLGNAVKFTEQGHVSVRVEPAEPAEPDGALDGLGLVLAMEVADTGCGICPEDLEAIFDSFEQSGPVARQRGGTGLGLSISRSFARMMGGDITVESEPEVGSRFRFTMVVEPGDAAEVAPRIPERRVKCVRPGQGEIRILVVDDRPANRDMLCRLLEKVGFVTREAENGAVGLDMLAEWRPQVALIDLVMPVMSGWETIRRMREMPEGQAVALVAVTASALDEER